MTYRTRWRLAALIVGTALAVGAGLIALRSASIELDLPFSALSVASMEAAIASWGAAAPAASIGLMILHSFLPFPAEMLAVANGMLFGFALGVGITWMGAMLGALLAFGLARRLGQPFVHRLVGAERWRKLEAWTLEGGTQALILARLTPVISFNLVNYAAGLAGVGWWTFTWTTAVGILPITVASVLVGSHMAVIPWQLWTLIVVAVVALMLLHRRYGKSSRGSKPLNKATARPPSCKP